MWPGGTTRLATVVRPLGAQTGHHYPGGYVSYSVLDVLDSRFLLDSKKLEVSDGSKRDKLVDRMGFESPSRRIICNLLILQSATLAKAASLAHRWHISARTSGRSTGASAGAIFPLAQSYTCAQFQHRRISPAVADLRYYHRNERGQVVKKQDHLVDALRYAVMASLLFAKVNPAAKKDFSMAAPQRPWAWE